jgi:hypothetical protein
MTGAVLIDPEQLIALADAARRLTVSHRDPHAFHEQKSELGVASGLGSMSVLPPHRAWLM